MAEKIRINRRKDYKEQLKLYINLSKNLNAKLKKLFRKTARQAEIEYIKFGDMYYYFLEDFGNSFYKLLANHYRTVITAQGERLIKQREKKQENAIDIAVAKYIQDVTATKVTEVSETTKESIRKSIKRGIAEGESIPTIAKDIRQNNAFKPYRATMIARTETHSAMNYGNHEISKSLDFDKPVKSWGSALDARTRSWHRAMNGTTVARDEMFKVLTPVAGGGFTERRMNFTGDYQNGGALNVINCRCFTLYYDSADDVIGASPEPDNPVVSVDDMPPVPEPKIPVGFVGFGNTTKLEQKYHEDSWNDSPEKYKAMVAKFAPITIRQRNNQGAFYQGGIAEPYINIPNKTYKGYDKQACFVHEYAHYMDNEIGSIIGAGFSKKINKRAKDLEDSYVIRRERMASLYYAKEMVKDAKKVNENIKNKYYISALDKDDLKKFEKDIEIKYPDIYNQSREKQKEFVEAMLSDGKFFSKDDLKQMFFFDTNKRKLLPQEIDGLIAFRHANIRGIVDNYQNYGEGVIARLKYLTEYRSVGTEYTINLRSNLGELADYIGAISTNTFGYGHRTSYYKNQRLETVRIDDIYISDHNSTEAFAEYMALSASPQSELFRKKMTDFAPNTKEGFDELVDEILTLKDASPL